MRLFRGIRSVSAAAAERAEFVICVGAAERTPFVDNVRTDCASCGKRIQHRPNAPQRPAKICLSCAVAIARADQLTKN